MKYENRPAFTSTKQVHTTKDNTKHDPRDPLSPNQVLISLTRYLTSFICIQQFMTDQNEDFFLLLQMKLVELFPKSKCLPVLFKIFEFLFSLSSTFH